MERYLFTLFFIDLIVMSLPRVLSLSFFPFSVLSCQKTRTMTTTTVEPNRNLVGVVVKTTSEGARMDGISLSFHSTWDGFFTVCSTFLFFFLEWTPFPDSPFDQHQSSLPCVYRWKLPLSSKPTMHSSLFLFPSSFSSFSCPFPSDRLSPGSIDEEMQEENSSSDQRLGRQHDTSVTWGQWMRCMKMKRRNSLRSQRELKGMRKKHACHQPPTRRKLLVKVVINSMNHRKY